jgi:hypothetical protein
MGPVTDWRKALLDWPDHESCQASSIQIMISVDCCSRICFQAKLRESRLVLQYHLREHRVVVIRNNERVKFLQAAKRHEETLTDRVGLTINGQPLRDEANVALMDSAGTETKWNLELIRANEENAEILKDWSE